MEVVVMCTANQCRSPIAEVLLQAAFEARGVQAHVGSAGLLPGGEPAVENAREAVRSLGLDLSGHLSRKIDRSIVDGADLVLGMERRHVREASVLAPGAFAKSFTLLDFIERAERSWTAGTSFEELLKAMSVGRSPKDLMRSGSDEVADPIGQPLAVFEATRNELTLHCKRVAELIARCT